MSKRFVAESSSDVIVADSLQVSFKQTHYRVTDSMTRSIIICSCSRLTSIHAYYTHVAELVLITSIAFDRAFSVHAFVADSLLSDELDDEINIECIFEADSLFLSFKQALSIQLQIFNDERVSAHIFVFSGM